MTKKLKMENKDIFYDYLTDQRKKRDENKYPIFCLFNLIFPSKNTHFTVS